MTEAIPQAEAFIQFRLDQMSSRNEHHEFEEVATRIARKRISANILIATGPVSSGGDQQRDAETYTTRVPDELPHAAGFSASASTTPIVVACTVQKDGLKQKALADLAGICTEDADPVDHVAFFSVHAIPAGTTHELKKTAQETHGVTLDIFSGADIATLLAEPDLVWVARHYLDLPSAMVPPPEGEPAPEWYADLLENLRLNHGPAALTTAAQGEVTRGMRHATWDSDANADLPEWLDFMGAFLADADDGEDTELVFRACYEMTIARFRGMGVATGAEDLVRRALNYACGSDHPGVVDDAVILVSYWGGIWRSGVGQATATEISEALERLREHATQLLDAVDATTHPVRAATLTGTLAFSHLVPDWRAAEHMYGQPEPADVDPLAGIKFEELEGDVTGLAANVIDIDSAMTYFDQLADLLPTAGVYSVRQLAKLFNYFALLAIDHPSYIKVRDSLDDATASVEGDAALADRCRNRGVAFYKAGRSLDALRELHETKARWFNGDTMYGALLAMRFISRVYDELGLSYAAKMYACAAATIAVLSGDADDMKHLPLALLEAAQYAQRAGTWADAAQLTENALLTRAMYLPDPFDFDKHPDLNWVGGNAALQLSAIRTFWPELEPVIKQAHDRTDWFETVDEMSGGAEYKITEAEFQAQAAEQFTGPVLGDLGPTRIIDFTALGVRWVFTFDNDRTTVLTAEGLCAAFQVLLADIARHEPVLVKSTVRIRVTVLAEASHEEDDVTVDRSGLEPTVNVSLSADISDIEAHATAVAAVCLPILETAHVRPAADLEGLMEATFADGAFHKLLIGRPYEDAAGLLQEEHYQRCATMSRPASSARFRPSAVAPLTASTAVGAGYNRDEALTAIRQRYEIAYTNLRYTYPRLLANKHTRATIVRLRDQRWLDWQILVALTNAVWNWRMNEAGIQISVNSPAPAQTLVKEPETPDSPRTPLRVFSNDSVDDHIALQTATVAKGWGLQAASGAFDAEALRELLTRRYQYAVDDVPHRDILDCLDENGYLMPFITNPNGGSV